jgi:hypothetical protein
MGRDLPKTSEIWKRRQPRPWGSGSTLSIIARLSSVELNKEFKGRKNTKRDLKSRKDN